MSRKKTVTGGGEGSESGSEEAGKRKKRISSLYDGRRVFIHQKRGVQAKNRADSDFFCQSTFMRDVMQEGVKAVCMSTYILNLEVLEEDFPMLTGIDSTIPFVLFHGDRVTALQKYDDKLGSFKHVHKNHEVRDEVRDEVQRNKSQGNAGDEEATMDERDSEDDDEEDRNDDIWFSFSANAHFIEVVTQGPRRFTGFGVERTIIQGVHHSKYILVFVESGVYVLISSANLTKDDSVDLTWIQFFPAIERKEANLSKAPMSKDPTSVSTNVPDSSFGWTLQNFLMHQSDQMIRHSSESIPPVSIMAWLRKHVSFKGDLVDMYDFSGASADLITVVPGTQVDDDDEVATEAPSISSARSSSRSSSSSGSSGSKRSHCDECNSDRIKTPLEYTEFSRMCRSVKAFRARRSCHSDSVYCSGALDEIPPHLDDMKNETRKFGLERVRQCLLESTDKFIGSLPSDKFGLQMTSICDSMTLKYLAHLIQSFDPRGKFRTSWLDDRLKLIWPTKKFVDAVVGKGRGRGRGLFFKNEVFRRMEPDVVSYFHDYRPNAAERLNHFTLLKTPHSKVYFRFSDLPKPHDDDDDDDDDDDEDPCNCTDVRWFILTSANLSLAAQGLNSEEYRKCSNCSMRIRSLYTYRNFEMGVLLKSTPTNQLKVLSSTCPVHSKAYIVQKSITVLPVPFSFSESREYCDKTTLDLKRHPYVK